MWPLCCSPLSYTLSRPINCLLVVIYKGEKLPGGFNRLLFQREKGEKRSLGTLACVKYTVHTHSSVFISPANALSSWISNDKCAQWVFKQYLSLERCCVSCLLPYFRLTDSFSPQFYLINAFWLFFFHQQLNWVLNQGFNNLVLINHSSGSFVQKSSSQIVKHGQKCHVCAHVSVHVCVCVYTCAFVVNLPEIKWHFL